MPETRQRGLAREVPAPVAGSGAIHDSRLGGSELRVGQLSGVVESHQPLEVVDGLAGRRGRRARRNHRRCGTRPAADLRARTVSRRSRSSRMASPRWTPGNSTAVWRRRTVTPSASSAANSRIQASCRNAGVGPQTTSQQQAAGRGVGHRRALAQLRRGQLAHEPARPGGAAEPRGEREHDAVDAQRDRDGEQQRRGDRPRLVHGGLVGGHLDQRVDDLVAADPADEQQQRPDDDEAPARSTRTPASARSPTCSQDRPRKATFKLAPGTTPWSVRSRPLRGRHVRFAHGQVGACSSSEQEPGVARAPAQLPASAPA